MRRSEIALFLDQALNIKGILNGQMLLNREKQWHYQNMLF